VDILGRRASTRDGGDGLASAIVEHVADNQFGTSLGHQSRGLSADATRGTREQCNLAIETIHAVGPPLSFGEKLTKHFQSPQTAVGETSVIV
jgi:hypothetical protein